MISGTKYVVLERIAEGMNLCCVIGLFSNYIILLFVGGFSLIDLVENSTTRKKYALKKITNHSLEDQKMALKEIEITQMIKHPNVTEILDFTVDGTPDDLTNRKSVIYILLPYYKNGSLDAYLNKRAKFQDNISEQQVLQIFLGICEGLRKVHENSIAHRDIKVANICLSETMDPIIVDFGSATAARCEIYNQSEAMALMDLAEEKCSLCYRAPELFQVESCAFIDERSDIWSLGCLLYALCFFKSPFDVVYEKGDSVSLAVISGNIKFPENSTYSTEMHEMILQMLRVNPIERPFIYGVIEKCQDLITKLENRL